MYIVKMWVPYTAWKVSKYGVLSGPHFPVFISSNGKHGLEKNSPLGHFSHSVTKKGLWDMTINVFSYLHGKPH